MVCSRYHYIKHPDLVSQFARDAFFIFINYLLSQLGSDEFGRSVRRRGRQQSALGPLGARGGDEHMQAVAESHARLLVRHDPRQVSVMGAGQRRLGSSRNTRGDTATVPDERYHASQFIGFQFLLYRVTRKCFDVQRLSL